jgi:hypothetical protein
LEDRLERALSRCSERLQEISRHVSSSGRISPPQTAREIFRDVVALSDEFESVTIDVPNQTISVTTEANILRLTDERASKHRQQIGGARLLKGKRSRSIPLNADFRGVLEQMPHHADGLVFHGPEGGRLKPDTVRIILVREVITPLKDNFPTPPGEVGFEHGRLHSFRHYFVSEAFRRGATEPWTMQWVGHRESRIVARYRHLRDDDGQREMARLDLLGTKKNPDGPGSV